MKTSFSFSLIFFNILSLTAMQVEVPDLQTEKQIEVHHQRTVNSFDRLGKTMDKILELKKAEERTAHIEREKRILKIAAGACGIGLACSSVGLISRHHRRIALPVAQLSTLVSAGCIVKLGISSLYSQ